MVKYNKLPAIYGNYDFAIFSSSCENLPNILLESMALGLPLLYSGMGPMSDIIKHGGIYFNPVSIEDIKEKLLEGISNPTKLLNKAIIAKQIALNQSWENAAKESIVYLTGILDQEVLNLE